MGLTIEALTTPEQLCALFELRYRIYIEELKGEFEQGAFADRQFRDKLDEVAINYALLNEGRVVGSLRVADLDWFDPTAIVERYALADLVSEVGCRAITLAGRLALDPAFRSHANMMRLIGRAVTDAVERGILFSVSDCSPGLVPLYRRLGYRVQGPAFRDPHFGTKVPIRWRLPAQRRHDLSLRPTGTPLTISDGSHRTSTLPGPAES